MVLSEMFTIPEALEATGGKLIQGDPVDAAIRGVSTDSRHLQEGDLFVALKGNRYDGYTFINEAFNRGAAGAVISVVGHRMPRTPEEEKIRRGKILIGVNDTLSALQALAGFHRDRFNIPVIAITGSNGKTTTKELAAWIISQDRKLLKSEGNFNNQIGVPLTLLRQASHHQVAVVEMGISRAGELRTLARIAKPVVGLIANIGPAHLETLGTLERVARAKSELLESLPMNSGMAILNRDDSFFDFLKELTPCPLLSFGLRAGAQVSAGDIDMADAFTTCFRLIVHPSVKEVISGGSECLASGLETEIRLPLPGIHNVLNAVAASAIALVSGCRLHQIKGALESFLPMSMRSQLLSWNEGFIVNDAYNANPASMRAALEMLSSFRTSGQRIAVLGDMLELGNTGHQAHREIGEYVAQITGARLMAVGPMGRWIAEAALSKGMPDERVSICDDADAATAAVLEVAEKKDVVLIKGSRGIHLERVVEGLLGA